MKPCIHVDTPPFDECCGGAKAMHYLAALLGAIGEDVTVTHPCPWHPLIGVRQPQDFNDNVITVYPEAHRGNRFNSKRVVRYILFYQTRYGGGDRISKDECAIVYEQAYLADAQSCCDHPLSEEDVITLPIMKSDWCFPEIKRRVLYYQGKGEDIKPEVPFEEITTKDHWRTLALLRSASDFYTTDKNTQMNKEAALCGSNVWWFENGKWALNEINVSYEGWTMNPIFDRFLAIKFAKRIYKFFGLEYLKPEL